MGWGVSFKLRRSNGLGQYAFNIWNTVKELVFRLCKEHLQTNKEKKKNKGTNKKFIKEVQ